MSGTLHELITELTAIKLALSSSAEGETETDDIDLCIAKVESAMTLAERLKDNRGDLRLRSNLAGTLREIIDTKKDPALATLIDSQSIDNLEKFFKPPVSSSSMFNKSGAEQPSRQEPKRASKHHS